MPLTDTQKNAFSTRLDSAYTQTRDLSETRPWAHEIVRDYGLGQDWPIVTAAYSGIEQTLKFLIALDRDITIQELIAIPGFRTHRLAFLFDHLSCENQRAAQRCYARWQSLHSHVNVTTCEEFLQLLEEDDGGGYQNWRYCLTQDRPPVANSADAMLAIWAALLRRAPDIPFPLGEVDDEVANRLHEALETACSNEERRRIERGEEALSIYEDWDRWVRSHTHPLDAMAQALSHYGSYCDVPDDVGGQPWRNALRNCLRDLRHQAGQKLKRGSLHTFTRRASGWFPNAASIRWNGDEQRFEDVPWSLESESMDEPPPQSQIVQYRNSTIARLRRLPNLARSRGYLLKETQAFAWRAAHSDRTWHLRLRLFDCAEGAERPRLSIWQRGHLEGPTAVEHHSAEPPLQAELETWVRLYVQPLRFNRHPS